jgi:ribosomal protein S18 acetylase RimI-like enzyme
MNFTLRPAQTEDCDWLVALRTATMREYVEQTWGFWDQAAQRARFHDPRERANMQVIVVAGRDAGLLHVERSAGDVFLANIQIKPEFQNRGLGTAVIRRLVAEAQAAGSPVRLQVLAVNRAARDLYERLGFVVSRETCTHCSMIWRPA